VICVLGDAHLDVIVSMSGALAVDTDTPARVQLSVGGQGANVAAWAVALGEQSRLIAAVADDPAGVLVAGELARRGVDLVGPVTSGHTGVIVALSDGGAHRSMLTDRGVGPSLSAAAIDPYWLHGCSWLHLSGYSLVVEPAREAALAAALAARAGSARLSVDLSSAAAIAAFGIASFRELITELAPDVVFADRAEADLVGEFAGIEVIRKLGADGVLAGGRHYPAVATTPVDATGAGDAFAAGYLVGGVALGLAAAARAVATMGAMP
jgi:sugar/nucleoside kinase (ribokinase family)